MFVSRDQTPIEDHSTQAVIVKSTIMSIIAVFVIAGGWFVRPDDTVWRYVVPGGLTAFGSYWLGPLWLMVFRELRRRNG